MASSEHNPRRGDGDPYRHSKKRRRLVDIGRKFNISKYRLLSRPIEKTRREILISGRLKRRINQAEELLAESQKQGCPDSHSNTRNT